MLHGLWGWIAWRTGIASSSSADLLLGFIAAHGLLGNSTLSLVWTQANTCSNMNETVASPSGGDSASKISLRPDYLDYESNESVLIPSRARNSEAEDGNGRGIYEKSSDLLPGRGSKDQAGQTDTPDGSGPPKCMTTSKIRQALLKSHLAITTLVLAAFSTAFSSLFLGIALIRPTLNHHFLSPSRAAFLTSFVAKLIELSFVTVAVAFLGQVLARRASHQGRPRGITIAEMNMRTWIMQPGVLLTHWEGLRYAGLSILGIVSLLATLTSILYTSAATALVQPQPVSKWQDKMLSAVVKSMYSNPTSISDRCITPINSLYDPDYSASTCLQLQWTGTSLTNYMGYANTSHLGNTSSQSSQLSQRPKGYALFNDNTTITAAWIEVENDTGQEDTKFYINNVTLAMPHTTLAQASFEPANGLIQQAVTSQLSIRGAMPSPTINVLCATLTGEDLTPFVYSQWADRNRTACDETTWSTWPSCLDYNGRDSYLNGTALDDIFRWGEEYGKNRYPPVFPVLPPDFNTVLNTTKGMFLAWGSTSIYLLGKGGPVDAYGQSTTTSNGTNYALCGISSGLTASCLTEYNATDNAATMQAICESDSMLQYNRSEGGYVLENNETLSKDFVNIAAEWAYSLNLDGGLFYNNASIARVLTQLIVTEDHLNPSMPSTAEALAVLAGGHLLEAARDSPVVQYWNYTVPSVDKGVYQQFNASVRMQQYKSGGNQSYQGFFYVVLFAVALMSALMLAYFVFHRDGWFADFSEPPHLFALALNSPPSRNMEGSCGGGPSGQQYNINWKLSDCDGHYYVESIPENTQIRGLRRRRKEMKEDFEMLIQRPNTDGDATLQPYQGS